MKIGLLPLYIRLYDECSPQYHAAEQAAADRVADALRRWGFEVESVPLCRVAGEFEAAIRGFEESGCQVMVTLHAAYSPSLESIDALVGSRLPIVVCDTTRDEEYGFEFGDKLMFNHGIHGVQDMCNMLLKRRKPFLIRAGHLSDDNFAARLRQAITAAAAVRRITGARVGAVGGEFQGMGDFKVPEGVFGSTMVRWADDPAYAPSGAEIESEIAEDRRNFAVAPGLPEEVHRATVASSLRLRKWIEAEKLDAFTVNFLGCGPELGLSCVPFLECSKAMTRKIGYAGEGDVLTALFCGALLSFNPDTTFSEMFCPDWKGNRIFLSHMGEMNLNLMAQKPFLSLRKWVFGGGGDIAVATGCLRGGETMLADLAPGPDGSFTLITAPVRMTAQNDTALTEMRGWMTPPGNMPVPEFLEAYSRVGGTHHLVLSYGCDAGMLEDIAALMGWRYHAING